MFPFVQLPCNWDLSNFLTVTLTLTTGICASNAFCGKYFSIEKLINFLLGVFMKNFFASLLVALAAVSAKATTETNKCNYEFKFTDINFGHPYSSEDKSYSPSSQAFYKQLEVLITAEMAKKGYYFLPNENTKYNFKFFVGSNPEVRVSYDTTSKTIEDMLTSPDNITYINGILDINGNHHLYPRNTILNGEFKPVITSEYSDSIKKAVAILPSCADIKNKTEFILDTSIVALKAAIEHNKNPQNNSYVPPFFGRYPIKQENYCVIDHAKPKCFIDNSPYFAGKASVSCHAKVKFKIKGDPRVFENYSVFKTGRARDKVNDPTNTISVVLNIPLFYIPSIVGSFVTAAMAKHEAKKYLEKYLSEFQACEE